MISSFTPRFLRFWLLLTCMLGSAAAWAQQRPELPPNTRRCVWVRLAPDRDLTEFSLPDTLTVVPTSVSIDGRAVAYDARTDRYRYRQARRVPAPDPGQPDIVVPGLDSVLVCYRVLPLRLAAPQFRRPRGLLDSMDFPQRRLGVQDFAVKEQILSTPGINKTGNLARGISFGNSQNVFVNSSLNLQLEGKLTDNINLTAAISDQSVPFQPEGNTQQLQEFDRIYITLTSQRWNLTAGDVVLRNKPDYFLRFYKNVQGAALEVNMGQPGAGLSGFSTPQLTPLPNYPGINPGTYSTTAITNGGQTPALSPSAAPGNVLPTAPGQVLPPGAQPAGVVSGTTNSVEQGRHGPVRSSTTVAGGVAKGKFASIDVTPIENVQGPYRLRGPNGEQFIIVLANSERVFLDGRLMTRGFDNDYVIDYNQAEVTFSPQHLITNNSRIKIDFEYSDFNYARSLYSASHYQQLGRLALHGNFYREADNPDNSPNLVLSDSDRVALRSLSENVAQASVAGGQPGKYNRQLVQYTREIRTVGGQQVEVFTYLTDSLRPAYDVRFTDVGPGNGDYRLSVDVNNASVNGRVYQYVGPKLGNYQPIRLLPAPLQKQIISAGASYQVDANSTVFVDLASSELDLNRFSPQSDKGQAMRVGYVVQDRKLPGVGLLKDYRFRSALDYEYTSPEFAPIDRYRDIEFDRNWSTASTVQGNATRRQARADNILNFAVGAAKDADNAVNYRLSRRFRSGEADGLQHWLDAARQVGGVQLRGSLFLLDSKAGASKSEWARGEAAARYVRGPVIPGYAYRFDKNRVASPSGDTVLLSSANYFDEHNVFIQSQDSAKTRFRADYTYRRDQTPNLQQSELQRRGTAQTWQGTMATRIGKSQDLAVLATYRDLAARDSARQRTVLTKIDWNASLLENQVRSELSYSVATGRELRRDYTFLAVPNGQGTHYYGGDTSPPNGREDRDEFLEAQTPDAVYRTHIKVYLPTDDYIIAFTNRFSYRLTTAAPRTWRDGGGWRQAIARFSAVSTVTLDRRTIDKSLSTRLNPFAFQTEDSLLLSLNKLLRNTIYFNRSNPVFGAELSVQQTQQKVLLSQGSDIRNLAAQSLLLRRTLAQSFTGRLNTSRTIRQSTSSYLDSRNFRLLIYEAAPEISYQPNGTVRFTGTYLRTNKSNTTPITPETEARGTFDELGIETRVSQVSKRTITASTRYVSIAFKGDPNSVVGLEILNALRPGGNFTWNLNVEQRLSNGLNLNLAYDGRKPQGLNVVHTGRMQVSVLF